jgi:microcystin-dependent protein
MEPFIGQIILVGFNFAPYGWFLCQGQLIPIAQYDTLYALIGTTYGGDGQTTFAVPDLRGRVPTHWGQGTGLSPYPIGERTGTESVTLINSQIGAHTHQFNASALFANTTTPDNTTTLAPASAGKDIYVYGTSAPNTSLAPGSISSVGGSSPHENRQPYLAFNYIMAWAGIFPSRN